MATEEMSVFNVEPSRFHLPPEHDNEANESAIADAAEDAAIQRGIEEQMMNEMEDEFDLNDEDED